MKKLNKIKIVFFLRKYTDEENSQRSDLNHEYVWETKAPVKRSIICSNGCVGFNCIMTSMDLTYSGRVIFVISWDQAKIWALHF